MTGYLNTDLDLMGPEPFDLLVAEIEQHAEVLHYARFDDGLWYARIESRVPDDEVAANSPDQDIQRLLQVIQQLTPAAHAQWQGLAAIEFDIGWEAAGHSDRQGRYRLIPSSLAGIAACGASLAATIYQAD